MRSIKILLLLIASLFIKGSVLAQEPLFIELAKEVVIPSNEIYSVIQDQKGFIWIGTDAGLYKYNGISFDPYFSDQQKSLAVTGLIMSSEGDIYVYNFSNQIFRTFKDSLIEIKGAPEGITSLLNDEKGNILVSAKGGIYIYNVQKKMWTKHLLKTYKNEPFYSHTRCLTLFQKKNYFIGNYQLNSYAEDNLQSFSIQNKPGQNNYLNEYFLVSSKDSLYLFDQLGSTVLVKRNQNLFSINNKELMEKLKNRKITHLRYLSDGNIWIMTYTGVIRFNPTSGETDEYFTRISFSDVLIDQEGNYWFTSLTNGLLRVPNLEIMVWTSSNSAMKTNKISELVETATHCYFSQFDGTIGTINKKNGIVTTVQLPQSGDIRGLKYLSIRNQLFFSLTKNIYFIERGQIKQLPGVFPPVKALAEYKGDLIIASSIGTQIFKEFNGNNKALILTENWCRSIISDENKSILFIGTSDGLMIFREINGAWKYNKTFLNGILITHICKGENGEKYLITFNGRIYKFGEKYISFVTSLSNGIQGRQIEYRNGSINVATNDGLWVFNIKKKIWRRWDKRNGLLSTDIRKVRLDSSGIWLATHGGVQFLKHKQIRTKSSSKIYLKTVLVNQQRTEDYKNLNLSPKDRLSARFESTAYSSDGTFDYAYRFKGFDSEWNIITAQNENIPFPLLQKGSFTLEIKLVDQFGRNSINSVFISGNISPPFYQRIWFYVLILLVALALSYLIFKYQLSTIQRRQKEKLSQIQLENELNLAQQEAIKAQMNPHFIFNVLNSIKGYIYANDKQNASTYLNRFSDLMRKTLELSNKKEVYLNEELLVLETYIELESMLIEDQFHCTIEIADEIDTGFIKIPPMLLQPYIENCFQHGLRHKEGEKWINIKIAYHKEEDCLEFNITDNGIGRQKSKEFNKKAQNHESFAMSASEKRIQLINNHYNVAEVKIIDNFNDENMPLGTTILLKICLNAS